LIFFIYFIILLYRINVGINYIWLNHKPLKLSIYDMNINIRKIALICVTQVMTIAMGLSVALASNAEVQSDSSSFNHKSIYSYTTKETKGSFSQTNNHSAKNYLAVDNDKLINTVKVFYNPVADQISVSFKLGRQNNVSIKVMDALGSEVLQLLNSNLEGGVQTLTFETNNKLTTGFYFVRVVAGSETVVKRISIR